MSAIEHKIFGIKHGDFRPANQLRETLLARVEKVLSDDLLLQLSMIYAPRIAFTNQTVDFNADYDLWTPWFSRTKLTADGGIVHNSKAAVAVFNGDCPILCLQQKNKLAVVHSGYRCLIRKDMKEEGIVETTIRQFNPTQIKTFIFGGIGPCCWVPEYDDKPEILNPELCRHPEVMRNYLSKTSDNSPFGAGHVSVNLYKLATELLRNLGVPENNITMDSCCTCCAREDGKPVFWSYTRLQSRKTRKCGWQKYEPGVA